MSSVPVYVGRWQDYSQKSLVLGDVVTLDVRSAGYLIAALSTFVGFVGTAIWSLSALIVHQYLAKDGKSDALDLQHRVLYRNPSSPIDAIWDIVKMCFAWRKSGGHARIKRLKFRSFMLTLPPLVVFIAFAVAGVFVSDIAGKTYASNNVRVKPMRCGTLLYDNTTLDTAGGQASWQKVINDTLAGRAYVDNCYGQSENIAQCSLFPTQAINYSTTEVECPFGTDASGKSLCLFNENNATQVDTGLMDTNDILGINTAPQNRILVRKRLTCSPINVTSYIVTNNSTDNSTGPTQLLNLGPVYNVSTYTTLYHTLTKSFGFSYQVDYIVPGPELWAPIQPLQVLDGDVGIVVLNSNSIRYLAPVQDIWFSATTPVDPGVGLPTAYIADSDIAVMGCVDQIQICNPNTTPFSCTIISSWLDILDAFMSIELNDYQLATAWRLIPLLADSSIFYSITGLGDNALLARRNVLDVISTGLPSNQWQIEVHGWFETSLAKLQAYVIQQVANSVDVDPSLSVNSPNPNGSSLQRAAASFCHNQRVRNTGGYQTFSFFGLMVVFCIGITMIVMSWVAEPLLGYIRGRASGSEKHDYREIARIIDRKLQLLRMTLWGSGYKEGWEKLLDDVPVMRAGMYFAPPQRMTEHEMEDYRYANKQDQSMFQQNGHNEEITDQHVPDVRMESGYAMGGEEVLGDDNEEVNSIMTSMTTVEGSNGLAGTHLDEAELSSNISSMIEDRNECETRGET